MARKHDLEFGDEIYIDCVRCKAQKGAYLSVDADRNIDGRPHEGTETVFYHCFECGLEADEPFPMERLERPVD